MTLKVSPIKYNRKMVIFVVVEDRSQLARAEEMLSSQIEQQQFGPEHDQSEVALRSKSGELEALRLLRFIKTLLIDEEQNREYLDCSAEDITEQRMAQEALHKTNRLLEIKSNQDGLTEISNRRCFEDVYIREWRRSKRSALQISLVMVDIDHFKSFNDQYGHQAGDRCLKQVAYALKQSVHRSADFVARYGGRSL